MKNTFLIIFAALLLSASEAEHTPLTITITNIQSAKGNIRVGIYTKNKDFPNEKDTYKNKIYKISKTGSILIKIDDLPYGEYAIGLYQDENKNETLDKNFVGIPKEPFAFSNNFQPRFSAPDFEDCSFQYAEKNSKISLKLLNY